MHWLAELDGRRIGVEVPASSANLGAGYDCIGLALSSSDRIDVEVRGWSRGEIELTVEGEGGGSYRRTARTASSAASRRPSRRPAGRCPTAVGWRIDMHNEIPLARGLGSSAAATVGGLVAGNALLGEPLTEADLLRLATRSRVTRTTPPRPSSAGSPCGPLDDGAVEALRFDAPRDLRPSCSSPTSGFRRPTCGALPARSPSRTRWPTSAESPSGWPVSPPGATTSSGLTLDRLHEPYRAAVYPPLPHLVAAAREAGASGLPVGGRLDGPRLRRQRPDDHPIEAAFERAADTCELDRPDRAVAPLNHGAQVAPETRCTDGYIPGRWGRIRVRGD